MIRFLLITALSLINCADNTIKLKFKRSFINSKLTSDNLISELRNNYVYVPISIGSPEQELNLNLKLSSYPTYVVDKVTKRTDIPTFEKDKSTSFVSDGQVKHFSFQDFNDALIAQETFSLNGKEAKDITFFDEVESAAYGEPLHVNSGVLGLHLSEGVDGSVVNTSLIKQLKKKDIIDSYAFTIKYTGDDKGELIIGGMPHEYDSDYSADDFVSTYTMNDQHSIEWGIKFNNITYNNVELGQNIPEADIQIESGVIEGNLEYANIIYEQFFRKYIEAGKCQKVQNKTACNYYYYVCDKKDVNYAEMLPLNFYVKDINFTFSLTEEDLFYELDGKKYFLVLFQNLESDYYQWILGKPFLKKYQMVFDIDKKTIGTYKAKKSSGLGYWWIAIVGFVVVIGLLVYIISFVLKKPRKKRATELDDDFDYTPVTKD